MNNAIHHLRQHFGFEEFRGLQREIIDHVLSSRDCLVLMPTGGGKSICYQVPALMMEGITIVVSPLISLMKDQVDGLKANGIPAACLNSSIPYDEEQEIAAGCIENRIRLLYLSPEKALSLLDPFLSKLNITLIAIDEAHCVSQWGHDFRPEYKEISRLRDIFPSVPLMALTATADKITRDDILSILKLREPGVFISSFNRPNLSLTVKQGLRKREKLQEIRSIIMHHSHGSGIIYCTSRKTVETLAAALQESGINAQPYHAGMPAAVRNSIQDAFINDDLSVVVATIAFGMGINKSNVRFVIHYNLPRSIESYYQEIGRGGRDGLPCSTVLFFSLTDLMMLREFAINSAQSDINLEKLRRMQEYAEARHCRRRILLSYFGEQRTENCGNCDICLHPPVTFNGTEIARKALSALSRIQQLGEQTGVSMLISVLRGLRHKDLLERKLNTIKTYGAGSEFSQTQWNQYLMQMIQLGALEIVYNANHALRITTFGEMILKGKYELFLHEMGLEQETETIFDERHVSINKSILPLNNFAEPEHNLLDLLRQLRREIAHELGIAPYLIFHDSTLRDMVTQTPGTRQEMLRINGVSENKFDHYGCRFLELINQTRNAGFHDDHEPGEKAKTNDTGRDRGSPNDDKNTSFHSIRDTEQRSFDIQLSEEIQEKIRKEIAAIPMKKGSYHLSPAIRELRKTYPRSHEPWSNAEIGLLKEFAQWIPGSSLLVSLFGRTEKALLSMTKQVEKINR